MPSPATTNGSSAYLNIQPNHARSHPHSIAPPSNHSSSSSDAQKPSWPKKVGSFIKPRKSISSTKKQSELTEESLQKFNILNEILYEKKSSFNPTGYSPYYKGLTDSSLVLNRQRVSVSSALSPEKESNDSSRSSSSRSSFAVKMQEWGSFLVSFGKEEKAVEVERRSGGSRRSSFSSSASSLKKRDSITTLAKELGLERELVSVSLKGNNEFFLVKGKPLRERDLPSESSSLLLVVSPPTPPSLPPISPPPQERQSPRTSSLSRVSPLPRRRSHPSPPTLPLPPVSLAPQAHPSPPQSLLASISPPPQEHQLSQPPPPPSPSTRLVAPPPHRHPLSSPPPTPAHPSPSPSPPPPSLILPVSPPPLEHTSPPPPPPSLPPVSSPPRAQPLPLPASPSQASPEQLLLSPSSSPPIPPQTSPQPSPPSQLALTSPQQERPPPSPPPQAQTSPTNITTKIADTIKTTNERAYTWADKYRPEALKDFICNRSKALELQNLAKEDDCGGHFIFEGPPGVGKRTMIWALLREAYGPDRVLAREESKLFALKINLRRIVSSSFLLDTTVSFQKRIKDNSIWLHIRGEAVESIRVTVRRSLQHVEVNLSEVKGYEKHIIVELIQETVNRLSKKALNCDKYNCQVIILNEADKLSADALLYIKWQLGKQRGGCSKIFFCCTDASKLQPIMSLCTVIKLLPPLNEEIVGVLEFIAKQEGKELPHQLAEKIANNSKNNLRQAVRSFEATWQANSPLKEDQEILTGWEDDIATIAKNIVEEQSPKQLYVIRGKLQILIEHNVCHEFIFKALVGELKKHLDEEFQAQLDSLYDDYKNLAWNRPDDTIKRQNDPLKKNLHHFMRIEEFIAKFMSWYKMSIVKKKGK